MVMQLSTFARLLGFSRDVAIHAAMGLGIVSEKQYVAAVQDGEASLERFKERAAAHDLTPPEAHRLMRHYALDRVPRATLRAAWTTGGGLRARWGEEILHLLDGTAGSAWSPPGPASNVPVLAAATGAETNWTFRRKAGLALVLLLGSLAAGFLLDLPSVWEIEIDGIGDLFALLLTDVLLSLWFVGWGLHYLGRARGPSTYRGRARGRVVGAVEQSDHSLDDNTVVATVYPMITVQYQVSARTHVGVFGDPDNETLRDIALVIGSTKDWPAGREVEVRYNPRDPSQFVLGRISRLRKGLLVVGVGSLALAVMHNVVLAHAAARWWSG